VRPRAGGPIAFAGLWEAWTGPNGEELETAAIVTTQANRALRPLHDRMPVVIAPDRWAEWLGEQLAPLDALKDLLAPYPDGAMAFWPVDRRDGNVGNADPDLFTALSMGDRALSRGLAAPLRK
jgi:putative SOS response-associated peptidase YedK